MIQKDYALIAEHVSRTLNIPGLDLVTILTILAALCDALQQDSPAFNESRFMETCFNVRR